MGQVTQFKGVVSKIFPARRGASFGLADQRGLYFNTKDQLPSFVREGATVSFEAEVGYNGKSCYVNERSLAEVAAPVPSGGPSGAPAGSFAAKDESIRYQSARKDALTVVGLLLTSGALKLPEAQAKKLGVIEAAVDRYTALYFEDIEHFGALTRADAEPAPKATKAPAPAAEGPDDELPE